MWLYLPSLSILFLYIQYISPLQWNVLKSVLTYVVAHRLLCASMWLYTLLVYCCVWQSEYFLSLSGLSMEICLRFIQILLAVYISLDLFFSPLNPLNNCIVVASLCLGPQIYCLGTRVTVNLQFMWPCYALRLELLGPCDLFLPVLQEALLLVKPLEVFQVFFFCLHRCSWFLLLLFYCGLYSICVNVAQTWFGMAEISCISHRYPLCLLVHYFLFILEWC